MPTKLDITIRYAIAAALLFALPLLSAGLSWAAKEPETVMVTFHVKAGKAEELNNLLLESWATYRRLQLVVPEPHIIARSVEGKTTFFELFSWKSHGVPDSPPTEVRDLWNRMEALCEPREGQSGINIVEVKMVQNIK